MTAGWITNVPGEEPRLERCLPGGAKPGTQSVEGPNGSMLTCVRCSVAFAAEALMGGPEPLQGKNAFTGGASVKQIAGAGILGPGSTPQR